MPAVGGEVLLSGGQLGPDLLTLGSGLPASLLWLCKVPELLTSLHESHPWRTCLHKLPPGEGGSKTRDDGAVSGPGFAWADKGKAEFVAHVEVLLCPLDSERLGLAWRQSPSSMQKHINSSSSPSAVDIYWYLVEKSWTWPLCARAIKLGHHRPQTPACP